MESEEYLTKRVEDQINWYGKESTTNKRCHLWARGLVIVFAALIPFIVSLCSLNGGLLNILVSLLGFFVVVITGISALLKFQENWTEYRTTSETLKHEKFLFQTKSSPYDNDTREAFNLFVKRIEKLISKENSTWIQYISKED